MGGIRTSHNVVGIFWREFHRNACPCGHYWHNESISQSCASSQKLCIFSEAVTLCRSSSPHTWPSPAPQLCSETRSLAGAAPKRMCGCFPHLLSPPKARIVQVRGIAAVDRTPYLRGVQRMHCVTLRERRLYLIMVLTRGHKQAVALVVRERHPLGRR